MSHEQPFYLLTRPDRFLYARPTP